MCDNDSDNVFYQESLHNSIRANDLSNMNTYLASHVKTLILPRFVELRVLCFVLFGQSVLASSRSSGPKLPLASCASHL